MKNNKNYCKFVSQVKSSQVKSSAKIVSLINNSFKIFLIALLILLFSISCKPKQDPNDGEDSEYSKDGLIPKAYWGTYYKTTGENITATVSSEAISFYQGSGIIYTFYTSDNKTSYSGGNIWNFRGRDGSGGIIKFGRNEKRQRVLYEDPAPNEKWTFIHNDDK